MKINFFSDAENIEMMNSVINMVKETDKPINVTQFWIDYKNKNASEREVKGLSKRFRDKLSVEMQKSTIIETDLKIRVLFVMNCPISMELFEEIQATPTSHITIDIQNQVLTYENQLTDFQLTVFNEKGEVPIARRNGRRYIKRPSEDVDDSKKKCKKKTLDEMLMAEDVERPLEFQEVFEEYDYEENFHEDVGQAGLQMIVKTEEASTSSTSSESTSSIEVIDFLQHFKYLVLSMGSVELKELKNEINEAIRSFQFQRIRIKQLQIVLKSTLKFVATSSEFATSSDSHFPLQEFLQLFQLMVANLEISEFSDFELKIREVLDEHGEKKIAICKLRLALQNVMEMISC